jgi:diguanylate cyclase (GGDEF)-like protein
MSLLRDISIKEIFDSLKKMRVSFQIILLLFVLFIGVLSGGYLVITQLKIFTNDAFAINNIGVIRGLIQRTTKKELSNINSDQLIIDVDNTFELIKSRYLYKKNDNYILNKEIINKFKDLENEWNELKQLYFDYRKLNTHSIDILSKSELCWDKANLLAYNVQKESEEKLNIYKKQIIIIVSLVGVFIISIIIIVYKIVHNSLELDVITDPMTKLYNRNYFNKVMTEQVGISRRYNSYFSLILIDIDYFKNVNDDFGHLKGDKVLILLAKILTDNIRNVDYIFRIGGEEFAIVAPNTNLKESKLMAEKYRLLVSETNFNLGRALTVSMGVAEYSTDKTNEMLFKDADRALYQAKDAGRNIVMTSPMTMQT